MGAAGGGRDTSDLWLIQALGPSSQTLPPQGVTYSVAWPRDLPLPVLTRRAQGWSVCQGKAWPTGAGQKAMREFRQVV